MRQFIILILALVIMFFCACSESTSPNNDPDATGDNNTAIDESGGTIQVDDIEIIVPAGAFSEAVKLKVSEDVEQISSDLVITKTYHLEGMPSDFNESIKVRLKYEGALSHKSYIVMGKVLSGDNIEEIVSYSFLPCEISGQYIESVINPLQTTEQPAKFSYDYNIGEQLVLYFFGLTDYQEYTSNGGHFHFEFPIDEIETVVELAAWLEETYEMFYNLGFNYSLADRSWAEITKVEVSVFPSTSKYERLSILDNYAYSFVFPDDEDYEIFKMRFDSSKFSQSNLDIIKTAAGCAFFELVLDANNPPEKRHNVWFIKACKTWAGELFTSETNYLPLDFIGNETSPLLGFEYSENNYREYGFGMSALVKYLCDGNRYGKDLLPLIFGEVRNGTDIINAIALSIDDSPEKWWPEFLSEYISGNIYNQPPSVFTSESALSGQCTITETDTTKTFSGVFSDFAADIYSITIDPEYIDNTDTLSLSIESPDIRDDYITILLFARRSGALELLGGGNEMMIPDIGDMTENNTILAVVANSLMEYPYNDDNEYTFTVNVEKQDHDIPVYDFNHVSVEPHLHGNYATSWGSETYEDVSPYGFSSDGTLHATEFTGDFYQEANGLLYEGTITCVFDESFDTIQSVSFEGSVSKTEEQYEFTLNFTGQNIEFYDDDWEGRHYRITGSQFSSNLVSFESRLEWTTKFNDEYWKEVTQLTPEDEYYIEIIFREIEE